MLSPSPICFGRLAGHHLGTLWRVAAVSVASLAWALSANSAFAGNANVGVSVTIDQPGFYGRVDIGNQPAPAVIYPQPVIIEQVPVAVHRRPIYLRVPPGHSRNWGRYCHLYRACGQPVYFVREAPRAYRDDGHRSDHDRRDERHERRSDRRDDRGERRQAHGHGHGHGHGRD